MKRDPDFCKRVDCGHAFQGTSGLYKCSLLCDDTSYCELIDRCDDCGQEMPKGCPYLLEFVILTG